MFSLHVTCRGIKHEEIEIEIEILKQIWVPKRLKTRHLAHPGFQNSSWRQPRQCQERARGSKGRPEGAKQESQRLRRDAFGLPEDEAMKGITRYPAEVLGMGHRIGSLKTGMEASLVILNGPLLDIRSQVTHMWIKGKPVSLESRHTRLYEKYRKRPKVPER